MKPTDVDDHQTPHEQCSLPSLTKSLRGAGRVVITARANSLGEHYATVGQGNVFCPPSSTESSARRSRVKPFTTHAELGDHNSHKAVPWVNSRKE